MYQNSPFTSIVNTIKNWYIPLIIGIIFIGMGIFTFTSPTSTYMALAMFFSLTFITSGIIEILFSYNNRRQMENWGWTFAFGVITFLIGFIMVAQPEIPKKALPIYIGVILLFRSFGAISFAIDIKRYGIKYWNLLLVFSLLGIIFSLLLIFNPKFAGITIITWTGAAFFTVGIFSILLSLHLKKIKDFSSRISDDLKRRHNEIMEEIRREINPK